ncbi:MAG: hypothetical protein JWN64_321 [Parcubacteria group bacterium]|nr:hypothetical protein [Parcubacteria group bacterium]
MATLVHHIDRLREKPDHVRHRIAIATSGLLTGLVAIGWAAAMASSGALTLAPTQVASNTGTGSDVKQAYTETKTGFSQLLGAAGAAVGATSTKPTLTVVDVKETSTFDTKEDTRTVIPF